MESCRRCGFARIALCVVTLVAWSTATSSAAEASADRSWRDLGEFSESLDSKIGSILTTEKVPGAVVALVSGSDVFVKTWGTTIAGGDGAVTPTTAFDIGSCSKAFASAAVGLLVQDGAVGFDDPVHPTVPELEVYDPWIVENVTYRDLLANRVGISRQVPLESYANHEIPVTEVLARLRYTAPAGPFRTTYSYWNPGFMTAALAVSRLSGMHYHEFLKSRIFEPLEMTNSASGPHAEVLEGAARGHAFNDGDPVVIDEPWYHNYQGAAGVFLSALDTATWMRLQLGHFPEVVNATTLRELHLPHTFLRGFDRRGVSPAPACLDEPYPCTYALGWSRSGFHDAPMISHGGGQFGWRAYIALLPTKDAGVAVFANSDRAMVREISLTVLDVVMGEEPGDWYEKAVALREMLTPQVMEGYFPEFFRPVKDAPPSLAISDYAGTYRHPGLGDVIVGVTDGGLAYRQVDGRIWDGILTHLGGNVFELEFEHVAVRAYLPMRARFRFEVDDGRAVAIQNTEKTTYVRVPES